MCLPRVSGDSESKEDEPVEGGLVRRVVEHLEELRATEMEHELGVDHKVLVETERRGIVFPVLGEFLAESNKHPVEPSQDVGRVVNLRLEYRDPRHEHRRRLLVKVLRDGGIPRFSKVTRDGGDPKTVLSRGVLVVRHELDHAARAGLERLPRRGDDLEVDGVGCLGGKGANLPRRCLANTNLRLADPGGLFVGRDSVTDQTRHLELLRRLMPVS